MKLNTKRTLLVGFAFLSICAFWQLYNAIIPKILTYTFNMNETWSGVIMAADNILGLFLLPFFGGLSDRSRNPLGRRKPFILFGTLAAAALMIFLPVLADSYYAQPATFKLVAFIFVLGLLLIAMGTYRSPAVALMPDITPKPLRSKANAIINLMGAVGGILYLLITSVLYSSARVSGMDHVSYLILFLIVAGIMLTALVVVMTCVPEPKWVAEVAEYDAQHPEQNLMEDDGSGNAELPAPVKRSLAFLLCSIALWFIAYNAVETWFTTYAAKMWNMGDGSASLCLTVATAGAIVSYIPIGVIASKIGRKKTILCGVTLMTGVFFLAFLYTLASNSFSPLLYVLFALIGLAWAGINVNSLPMVVEMCKGSDIGRFTGLYYTFSMAAQTITPILAGFLLNRVGYHTLFPYSAVFAALALVTMSQVRHGDSKAEAKKGLEAFDVED